jgi:hypothetical protein
MITVYFGFLIVAYQIGASLSFIHAGMGIPYESCVPNISIIFTHFMNEPCKNYVISGQIRRELCAYDDIIKPLLLNMLIHTLQ